MVFAQNLSPADEERAHKIFTKVRCMVCSGESIAEAQTEFSIQTREYIRSLIAAKHSDSEILALLRQKYGDEIVFEPVLKWYTAPLWIIPSLLMLWAIYLFYNASKSSNVIK